MPHSYPLLLSWLSQNPFQALSCLSFSASLCSGFPFSCPVSGPSALFALLACLRRRSSSKGCILALRSFSWDSSMSSLSALAWSAGDPSSAVLAGSLGTPASFLFTYWALSVPGPSTQRSNCLQKQRPTRSLAQAPRYHEKQRTVLRH